MKGCFFECAPFELLYIPSAGNVPLDTLLALGLNFITLQSLIFACDTSSIESQRRTTITTTAAAKAGSEEEEEQNASPGNLPLRLFDCFGFGTASTFFPIVPALRVERDGDLIVVLELALSGSGS